MKKNHLLVKTIAAILVLTFSSSQIVWAVDVRQMLLDAKTFFDEQDAQRPHGMSGADLEAAEAQQQSQVQQQQMLEDFQNTAFSLTTPNGDVLKYVGDKLDSVQRPDGTQLDNILTDAVGNIQEADLRLADGSVQVYENGQVIGYMTPDGSQVIYENGEVKKVIDKNGVETLYTYTKNAQGVVTETVLDNPAYLTKYDTDGKIKEATRKSDQQKIFYVNGMIESIQNADGSLVLFTSEIVDGDTLLTPQGGGGGPAPGPVPTTYVDAEGNVYHFDSGEVTSIELPDGSTLDSITWDTDDSLKDANLTESDGSRHIYQNKTLVRSFDAAGIVTNYTYNATNILAVKAGETWEYALDKTPVKFTSLIGNITTFIQSGPYKGFKQTETISGQTYTYSYQGSAPNIIAQRMGGSVSVLLPNTLYQTSARSVLSWNGGQAWFSYEQPYGKDYLQTHWANQWVDYAVNMSQAGDLKIALQASDSNALPAGYTAFSLQLSVDGVLKGTMSVPAANNVWKDGVLTLTGLSQGNHTIRVKFANFVSSGGQQTDFKFRNIMFTRISQEVIPVTSGYTSTPLTSRMDTLLTGNFIRPETPSGGTVGASDFTSIRYDSSSNLKEVLLNDGTRLVFEGGMLKEAYDAQSNLTTFNFAQSGLQNITGSSIAQNGLTSIYSAEGKISSIALDDLTVHYASDGATVDWIEKADGTELYNMTFDPDGDLADATLYSPEGEERVYVAGRLAEIRRPDHSKLFYANDQVTQMVTPENITYNFTYSPTKIEATILQGTVHPDSLTPVRMEYDLDFNLKKVVRQNQEILNYLNTELVQIDVPNDASKVFTYQKDAQGNILSYTVTQGSAVTYYDGNDQPTHSVISPTAENPHTFDITYQYGKMREVKKDGIVVFTYSYSFDTAGKEFTILEDLEKNTTKTYEDGNLVSSLDKGTNVLSSYEYEPFVIASPEGAKQSMRVRQVTISRFGRTLHTYDYSYDGENTLVADETGVTRTYDQDEKLIFLERDGQNFAYTYTTETVTTQNGPPVTTETLLPNTLYQTTARSVLSWSGGPAWFSYEQPYGKDYLQTHWAGQWVEYTVNMSQAGDLKIALETSDSNALPAGYTNFQLELSVDGAVKSAMNVLATANGVWQAGTATLTGLTQGSHVIRVKFSNFLSSGGQQTDFKFRNLSFRQLVTTQSSTSQTANVTTEELVERRMSDGSIVHYQGGKVSRIDHQDGIVFKDLAYDTDGNISEVRVFQGSHDPVGTKLFFEDGRLEKVTLSTGQDLLYAYEQDELGHAAATWVQKGAAHLKYDAQGSLEGLRIDGVMSPDELLAVTTHEYSGGNGGFLGYDGNPQTAHTGAFGGGTGNSNTYLSAEHTLPEANAITRFSYRLDTSAYSNGSTNNGSSASIYLETKDATTGSWTIVPGTYAAQNHNNGGGGGSTAYARTPGTDLVTLDVDIPNVIAVRANSTAAAYSNGGGSYGGQAFIYEVQFDLADESSLTYSATTASGSQIEGYTFSGYVGNIAFDAVGNLTQSDPDLAAVQQELVGAIQDFTRIPYLEEAALAVLSDASGSEVVVLQEYSEDGTLETQTKGDGTVTLFDNNKPQKVLDPKGRVLIEYVYDADGNPTRVYLKNARDVLPDQMDAARLEIESNRAESLRALAAQRNLAYQSIEAQFQNARLVLNAQLDSQQGLYDNISSVEVKGKEAKNAKADALAQLADNLATIQGNLASFYAQEADAYAALDAQVMALSNQIEEDAEAAFTQLATYEVELKKEILRQEVSPIIYDYYRRILGRDPDTNEYNFWMSVINYNSGSGITEVKMVGGLNLTFGLAIHINALPELSQRQAYVQSIKTAVTAQINSYLAMTQTQKEVFAATVGLTAQDLIPLSSGDAAAILNWLNSRSLHFGQSAFLALESLLDQKGISYSRTELAEQAILVDILSGVISPLDDGNLVISVFALNKVASLYGLDLAGAALTWDDLRVILPAEGGAGTPRVIAHINGNHYVMITSITDTSVTYVDPGIGKDKQNETVTVAKEGFLKSWKGNVTLERSQVQLVSGYQNKLLSAGQSKGIRGANWGSWLNFVGWILSFTPLAPIAWIFNVAAFVASVAEGDWISAISSVVSLGFGDIGKGLQGFFKGTFEGVTQTLGPLGQAIQSVGTFFGNVYSGVTGFVDSAINFIPGLGPALQNAALELGGASVGTLIINEALSAGLTVGVSKGLESLGIDPQTAGFVGSLTSGAVVGALSPQTKNLSGEMVSRADMIQTSVQQVVTLQNIGQLGLELGLDPAFTNILGLSLGAIQGVLIQNPQTSLEQAFSYVKPKIAESMLNYGFQELGDSIGLNPILSAIIGAPISTAFAQTLTGTQWQGQVPANASEQVSVNDTVMRGEGSVEIPIPGPGTPERSWWDNAISFLQNNLSNMVAAGVSAYYVSQSRPVVPGTIPPPPVSTEIPIPDGATAVTYEDAFTGQVKQGYQINSSQNSYIVYDRSTSAPVKRVSNSLVEEGRFEYIAVLKADGSVAIDYTNPAYISDGEIQYTTPEGGEARFMIQEKEVQEIYIDVNASDIVLSPGTVKNTSNKVISGIVKILALGLELAVTNGLPKKQDGSEQGSQELTRRLQTAYIFGNGFENDVRPEETPDGLMTDFIDNVQSDGVISAVRTLFVSLYEVSDLVGNAVDWYSDFQASDELKDFIAFLQRGGQAVKDFFANASSVFNVPAALRPWYEAWQNWYHNNSGLGNDLVQETIQAIESFIQERGAFQDAIVMAHSGATVPLLTAIEQMQYDVDTVIIYEGPHPDYKTTFTNPNLNRIIHVIGTAGPLDGDAYVPFLGKAEFGGVENINITIEGAFHSDFSYDPEYWENVQYGGQSAAQAEILRAQDQERNRKVNAFMRLLYQAVSSDQTNPGRLSLFLSRTVGVTYDSTTKFATINLNLLEI